MSSWFSITRFYFVNKNFFMTVDFAFSGSICHNIKLYVDCIIYIILQAGVWHMSLYKKNQYI